MTTTTTMTLITGASQKIQTFSTEIRITVMFGGYLSCCCWCCCCRHHCCSRVHMHDIRVSLSHCHTHVSATIKCLSAAAKYPTQCRRNKTGRRGIVMLCGGILSVTARPVANNTLYKHTRFGPADRPCLSDVLCPMLRWMLAENLTEMLTVCHCAQTSGATAAAAAESSFSYAAEVKIISAREPTFHLIWIVN